jgi:DNA-binding transcriptional regulator YhcF (GntR family)
VKGSSRTLEYRLTMKSVDPTMVAAGKVRHSDRRLSAQHIVIVDNQSPRKEPSTSERIAAYLREAILSGEIPPGSRIRQEEIAERLGTSRLPVREALRMLEVERLTQLEVNRSARSRARSRRIGRDLSDARAHRDTCFEAVDASPGVQY